ncbi:MAG: alkaline phosphatase D family protein, partial [Actinomycetota bacterium]|nr:alkaline phosphatase D family protein [Actinomycetota bacterium]
MSRPKILTRRELVAAGTLLGAAAYVPPAWGRLLAEKAFVGPGTFEDGVASGEPAPDAVTFWGRLTTERPRSGAKLLVAEDEGLTRTVATVVVPTGRAIDGALKTRVTGLQPNRFYFYAWQSTDAVSPVGRTKTAPAADSDVPLNLAYSSCQNYPVGFFNGHMEAAGLPDLDVYMFLGDYTYEYGPEAGEVPGRAKPTPALDLRSYRETLKLYRADPGLRELHRRHPIVHVWDDHEVADNYTENNPAPSNLQRTAAYRASFEWLPRMVMPSDRFRIYRETILGRQAEVILLDQRQYRTGDGDGQPRRLLGDAQMEYFLGRLRSSQARWKIVGNAVMIAPLKVTAVPVNADQWDGYPDDRKRVLDTIADSKVSDVVFLTGDIHTYMANQVLRNADSGPSIATEYIGGSITSEGLPDSGGVLETAVLTGNPWIKQFNGAAKGYGQVGLTREAARITYRVSDITRPGAPHSTLSAYTQPVGVNDFTRDAGGAGPVNAGAPAAPTGRAVRSS